MQIKYSLKYFYKFGKTLAVLSEENAYDSYCVNSLVTGNVAVKRNLVLVILLSTAGDGQRY